MKNILLIMALLGSLAAVAQKAETGVLVSSGSTLTNEEGSLDWIIGENFVDDQLLSGSSPTAVEAPELRNHLFEVFPTVTTDLVTLAATEIAIGSLRYEVYDVNKSLVTADKWQSNPVQLNMTDYAPAMYLILIFDGEKELCAAFKVVKK